MTPALTFCGECGCALPDVPEAVEIHERWHASFLPSAFYQLPPQPPRDYYHMGSRSWEIR